MYENDALSEIGHKLVTIVQMAPFTPKSTLKLRFDLHIRYSIPVLIRLNPNNHYNHGFLTLLTITTMFIVTI